MDLYVQLMYTFPTRPPQTLDGIIKLFEDILVEEGLLEEITFGKAKSREGLDPKCDENNAEEQLIHHARFDEENLSLSVGDDNAKTIRVLQHSLEKLVDENEEVTPELNFDYSLCVWRLNLISIE